SGVPLEQISRLIGHSGTAVTEAVYRKQFKPVLDEGATAMDDLFPLAGSHSVSHSGDDDPGDENSPEHCPG
ncbi:hypothetical protein ACFQE5_13880, partial [Pseudonocardia hispaniensis]